MTGGSGISWTMYKSFALQTDNHTSTSLLKLFMDQKLSCHPTVSEHCRQDVMCSCILFIFIAVWNRSNTPPMYGSFWASCWFTATCWCLCYLVQCSISVNKTLVRCLIYFGEIITVGVCASVCDVGMLLTGVDWSAMFLPLSEFGWRMNGSSEGFPC